MGTVVRQTLGSRGSKCIFSVEKINMKLICSACMCLCVQQSVEMCETQFALSCIKGTHWGKFSSINRHFLEHVTNRKRQCSQSDLSNCMISGWLRKTEIQELTEYSEYTYSFTFWLTFKYWHFWSHTLLIRLDVMLSHELKSCGTQLS